MFSVPGPAVWMRSMTTWSFPTCRIWPPLMAMPLPLFRLVDRCQYCFVPPGPLPKLAQDLAEQLGGAHVHVEPLPGALHVAVGVDRLLDDAAGAQLVPAALGAPVAGGPQHPAGLLLAHRVQLLVGVALPERGERATGLAAPDTGDHLADEVAGALLDGPPVLGLGGVQVVHVADGEAELVGAAVARVQQGLLQPAGGGALAHQGLVQLLGHRGGQLG